MLGRRLTLVCVCSVVGAALLAGPALRLERGSGHAQSEAPRIAFSGYRNGNWDIYSVRGDGLDLRRITTHEGDDSAPAWSSDGTQLAFSSRRGGNWDIYVVSADSPRARRLTSDPHYDGAPAWSPDGKRIAFESYRAGDLDVWIMNADGTDQTNLTSNSPSGDFDPSWSPDGGRLAYTSWSRGDNDVFVMDLVSESTVQWTDSPRPESNPVWLPGGNFLSFVQEEPDRRELQVADSARGPAAGGTPFRLTWYGRDDSAAWSPDARHLAYVSHQHTDKDSELLLVQDFGEAISDTVHLPLPRTVLEGWEVAGPLSWCSVDSPLGESVDMAQQVGTADETPTEPGSSDAFVYLEEITAPNAKLPPALVDSFRAMRAEVREASERDFLGELSDMWRGLDASSDTSAYSSWHKAGRAFDTLFEFRDEDELPVLEVVREEIGGETYWRIFIRALRQDGSQGRPLKVNPWNLTGAARRKFPADGGTWKPVPYGYWVDLSEIIRHHGWERISSIDRKEFSWRWHFLAIEYWHHQRREGLTWYDAMLQSYQEGVIEEEYNWMRLVREGERAYSVLNNGVPVPPEVSWWWDIRP